MSKFLTPLRVERIAGWDTRGTWQLLSLLAYVSDVADTTFVVPAGFITDFASVPRVPIAFLLAGDTAHEAAVIHDWIYTTHEVDRQMADAVFREACLVDDVPWWRAWLMWSAVRIGGSSPWDSAGPRQNESVLRALQSARPLQPSAYTDRIQNMKIPHLDSDAYTDEWF